MATVRELERERDELGHHRLDRLQPDHVEALYARLPGDGLAGSTILQTHRVLARGSRECAVRDSNPEPAD